jgi:hypothetical protein
MTSPRSNVVDIRKYADMRERRAMAEVVLEEDVTPAWYLRGLRWDAVELMGLCSAVVLLAYLLRGGRVDGSIAITMLCGAWLSFGMLPSIVFLVYRVRKIGQPVPIENRSVSIAVVSLLLSCALVPLLWFAPGPLQKPHQAPAPQKTALAMFPVVDSKGCFWHIIDMGGKFDAEPVLNATGKQSCQAGDHAAVQEPSKRQVMAPQSPARH